MKRMTIAELDEFALFWAPAIMRRAAERGDRWTVNFVRGILNRYHKWRNWMPSPKQELVMRRLVAGQRQAPPKRRCALTADEPLIEVEEEGGQAA